MAFMCAHIDLSWRHCVADSSVPCEMYLLLHPASAIKPIWQAVRQHNYLYMNRNQKGMLQSIRLFGMILCQQKLLAIES